MIARVVVFLLNGVKNLFAGFSSLGYLVIVVVALLTDLQ